MKETLLLLLLLITTACFSQEKNCTSFLNGKFKYINPAFVNYIVTRNGTLQTEIDTINKISVEGSVKWLSDCKYELTYTKINSPNSQKLIGQKVNVEIIEIENNKITCLSKMNDVILKLEMIKIE